LLTFAEEMRATVFFIFLCSLFLFNGTHSVINHAQPYCVCASSSHSQSIEQPCSLGNSVDTNRIFEDADFDSTEENNNNLDKSNKISSLTNDLVNQWQLEFLGLVILKNNFKGFKNFKSYFTYSQPLYILQSVLRI
jgi:hypothetical protein